MVNIGDLQGYYDIVVELLSDASYSGCIMTNDMGKTSYIIYSQQVG